MDKFEFCSKLTNDLQSLLNFIQENNNLFYEIKVPPKYPYFPPKDSQSLLIGNVAILLMSAKLQVEYLNEFLLFPETRIL